MRGLLRQIRGALGNALVWGLSWFGIGFIAMAALWGGPRPWEAILAISGYLGATGFLTGGAVAGLLRAAYRGQSLLEISVGRFALGGALVAALCSPLLFGLDMMLLGLWVEAGSFVRLGLSGAVFGAITAGATMKLAQRAARVLSEGAQAQLENEQEEVRSLLEESAT